MPTTLLVIGLFLGPAIGYAEDQIQQPAANPAQAEQAQFFETKIRPLLAKRCYECHGDKEQESELRLDSLWAMLKGGVSGPAVVPGKPVESLLVTAIGYKLQDLKMPPDGKLSEREIADLTQWVTSGAYYPNAGPLPLAKTGVRDWEQARRFWSFQKPVEPAPPAVRDAAWPRTGLDPFVLAGLESRGLRPAPAADKQTWIRRVTFDLIGLPPTPEEVRAFLADDSPQAMAAVVERLLASPHYGERWGRHWLDVARYADSNGLDENLAHGNAWRYRDYVIASFNQDKPFDQFLQEQLAGDLLPAEDPQIRNSRLIATGFLLLGPKVLAEVDAQKMEMDLIDEQVDTLGKALLGLTLGCARCHDHKFDPITAEDYYGLAGIFKSTQTMDSFTKIAKWHENPLASPDYDRLKLEHERRVAEQKSAIAAVVEEANQKLKAAQAEKPAEKAKDTPAVENPAPAAKPAEKPKPASPEEQYDPPVRERLAQLRKDLAALEKSPPEPVTAMGVAEGKIVDVALHIRGSHLALGSVVPRHLPTVLTSKVAGTFQVPSANGSDELPPGEPTAFDGQQSGRLRLAKWLTSPEHPLTGRVMANRIWRWHFGKGIVTTPDNFGLQGERPTHPELLDWLALRFVESGWSIKHMHRLIVLSATYGMSSASDPQAAQIDPDNRWYWRRDVRRLEAEAIRDAMLSVSGQLELTMGGSLLGIKNREFVFDHTSIDGTRYDSLRRSVYLPVIRNHLYEMFQLFDYSDASVLSGNRASTTVAPQALFMMNSDFVVDRSRKLAGRICADVPAGPDVSKTDADRIRRLYALSFGRAPTDAELSRTQAFLARSRGGPSPASEKSAEDAEISSWQGLCHILLSSNEFIFLR